MFTGSTNSSKKAKLSLLSLRIPLSEKMAREAAETVTEKNDGLKMTQLPT